MKVLDVQTGFSIWNSGIYLWAYMHLQGRKGVWIKLPMEHANLIEAAVKVNAKFVTYGSFWWTHKINESRPFYASYSISIYHGGSIFMLMRSDHFHKLSVLLHFAWRLLVPPCWTRDYLMLVHWIPNTAHTLPANFSHRVLNWCFCDHS